MTPRKGASREYRVGAREPGPAAVRRMARGRAEHAVELLGDEAADPVEAVHEARKDMKKLRSLLRLVRDELGEEVYRAENQRFRGAAALLSDVRDAQVREATLADLRRCCGDGELSGRDWTALHAALGGGDAAGPDPQRVRRAMDEAAAQVEAGRRRIADWPLESEGFGLFERGLRRAYRRGRSRYAEASGAPEVEALHEWRKRVKDLWYHLRILASAWPPVLEAMADQAHELSDRLGDDHDLALLRDASERRVSPRAPRRHERLGALIDQRRAELQAEALALGERLYAEKPKAFARRLRRAWEAERP